ncbi:MAG: RsiV family protein [Proteobacteria bacterium]|nr:RsiV family protein [Pseudomonadota bacterium]
MRISACVHTRLAAPLLALALLVPALTGCGLERATPTPDAPAAPANATAPNSAADAIPAPQPVAAPAFTAESVAHRLSVLVNDTDLSSPDFARLRAEIVQAGGSQPYSGGASLPGDLRLAISRVAGFNPPNMRERWQRHQHALDSAAALYAEHPPVDTDALSGAKVLRRLGPSLYLVRLQGGDTAFFSTPFSARRLKVGAKLRGIPALEQPHVKADRAKGDLVEELDEAGRTYVAITRQEAQRIKAERAPVLARLKELEAERAHFQRSVDEDLASLDSLARDVNAIISPRLLGLSSVDAYGGFGERTARSARIVRQVKRLSHTYSPMQYYRYTLPVTSRKQIDAVLSGYIEGRKKDMLDLLHAVGVGRGHARANADLVAFKSFTASPGLLSVRFEASRDTGGAHPNQSFASFVFDVEHQTALGLGNLFRDLPAALGLLSELAQRRMELVLDGHVFPEGFAPKAENFSIFVIDGQDLVFSFPPYQMASYAEGPQTLRVPLAHPRLMPLLSPRLLTILGARPVL